MEGSHQNRARDRILHSAFGSDSIKKRLLVAQGLVLLAVWLGAAIFTKLQAFEESRNFLSRMAAADAEMVLALVKGQTSRLEPPDLSDARTVGYWRNGALVWETNADSDLQLSQFRGGDIDTVQRFGDHNWVITTRCAGPDCVSVAIRDTERKFAIRRLVASIFLPLLAIFLATLAATYLAVRIGLRPLDRLANDLNSIDLDRLQQLPRHRHPVELRPLAKAIDTLTGRLRAQLGRERSFLDACAHEIRTPITGLTSQVQTMLSLTGDALSDPLKSQLEQIDGSARKTARIADQFLGLARTNNGLADGRGVTRFNLCEVVRLVLSDFASMYPGADMELAAPQNIHVEGDPFGVELVVQNLMDNAIKHAGTDRALKILVTCEQTENGPVLRVEDNGQGVDAENCALMTERFVRLADMKSEPQPTRSGAGLGLSIVKEVVTAWGGSLTLGNGLVLGGLCVQATIPIEMQGGP